MISSANKHGYRGVAEMRGQDRWRACLIHEGKKHTMYAATIEEVAKLFDKKAKELGIYEKLLKLSTPKEKQERKIRKLGSVTFQKDRKRWRARIRTNGKEHFCYAKTKEEAEKELLQLGKELGLLGRLTAEPKEYERKGTRPGPTYTLEELKAKKEAKPKWKDLPEERKVKDLKRAKEKREKDPEKYRERGRAGYQRNREKVLEKSKTYRENNKDKIRAWRKHRDHAKRSACPKWAWVETREKVRELQTEIEAARNEGRELHIDHIIPVKGKAGKIHVVCGLHISYNLRLLSATENIQKSCYNWDDQWTYDSSELKRLKELEHRFKNTELACS